ncbi:14-3-3-like signal transduction protein [Ordospora colligata]|uniref:14-3-3-like signal transduction protein n=1 Tax=Ordospora colligata OC4 TaxID=1354746 RepID=A0A0B2ULY7_9MICR|nr:14-3-3-like signal transduction protein [Ordospora colligata OC4]KHN70087.1 14-3-3-like signal transduction protein [Ordospora colligata OC4]TBU16469.1 14-3-3-like signal transduction protein [Ordospora colligata]TBU16654.1 14-3-3-like signal transduction protein [Ordospora colligata]TBU19227.1 14-3-3-like signal transduction protein [Ordospora colligata]
MTSRQYEEMLQRANLSDMAERYDDMASEMKLAVALAHENKHVLNVNARNLFSVAYKNLVSSRRSSWRILCSEKQKVEGKGPEIVSVIEEKIKIVENELLKFCDEVLDIISTYILSLDDAKRNAEYCIFFLKMKGDYYRYKAEVVGGSEHKDASKCAAESYEEATNKAKPLPSTNPIKLGLALNYSVFHYEILNDSDKACQIAKSAFDEAIKELDALSEEHYRDSTLIMQLLRDNLTLWTSREETGAMGDEGAKGEPDE